MLNGLWPFDIPKSVTASRKKGKILTQPGWEAAEEAVWVNVMQIPKEEIITEQIFCIDTNKFHSWRHPAPLYFTSVAGV